MKKDGRSISVSALNERRRRAVRLRLAGASLAKASALTALSHPTIIAALKSYRLGGWRAVPVGPRGRGIRKLRAQARAKKHSPYARLASAAGLQWLESESIHILREAAAEAANPVMLYSMGKDSTVLLHLACKAFYPGKPPFPLLHIDTTWKFREMYAFRDRVAKDGVMRLIVHVNEEGVNKGINPFDHGSAAYTDIMKTRALRQALERNGFDAAIGGARRDEEKSRAKERICSFRNAQHRWEPSSQRPELWQLYNLRVRKNESVRVFPLSNWTELDIWQYIQREKIEVVPLYFAQPRPIVERDGALIVVDDQRFRLHKGERPLTKVVRFRTLGCYPLTGAIESTARSVDEIVRETLIAQTTERQGRVIDFDQRASMEQKKRDGYF